MYAQHSNLNIIRFTEFSDIRRQLEYECADGAHFTNGTYAYKAEQIVPTTIEGFRYVLKQQPTLPLVIAVNSDKSMTALGKKDFELQTYRAEKVAEPLARAFPDSQIIVIFYDEKTPVELYKALSKSKVTSTLHKWGYGTTPDAPVIEGAQYFKSVYAYPLPNDRKPVCYYQTRLPEAKGEVAYKVVDLRSRFNGSQEKQSMFTSRNLLFSGAVAATGVVLACAATADNSPCRLG